jgi:phenylacetate-coenzyme A ligase PaaK-like adenylate-forming protein
MPRPVAFNAFSQGHVTGPLFHSALRRLGAVVYDRSHHPEELFSTLAQTELFDFDTLVLPAHAARGKGVGLLDLLDDDPEFLVRNGIRWWMGSSGTFDVETVNRAQDQGVQVVSNLYGSSEFAPFALSCPENPGEFHLAQGHVLAEVVDQSGRPVASGQFGRIVVTHLCGMNEDGQACLHRGTQILRLAAGDGATVFHEPCKCGPSCRGASNELGRKPARAIRTMTPSSVVVGTKPTFASPRLKARIPENPRPDPVATASGGDERNCAGREKFDPLRATDAVP